MNGDTRTTTAPGHARVYLPLVWIAAGLFLLSLLIPAVRTDLHMNERDVPLWFPGWAALGYALNFLLNPQSFVEAPRFTLHVAASGLTNLFLLLALIRLRRRDTPPARWWHWAAWASVLINGTVRPLDWPDASLGAGYYVWLLSFVILAVSFTTTGARKVEGATQPSSA